MATYDIRTRIININNVDEELKKYSGATFNFVKHGQTRIIWNKWTGWI